MGYLSKAVLSSAALTLLDSQFVTGKSSAITYFFSVSKLLKSLDCNNVDLDNDGNRIKFIDNCEHFLSINTEEKVLWNPFQKVEWDALRNTSPWHKDKTCSSFVTSNLLTKAYSDKQSKSPKTKPLLDFSQSGAGIHSDAKDNFLYYFNNNIDVLRSFSYFALRDISFPSDTIKLSEILDVLVDNFGFAGQLTKDILVSSGEDLTLDVSTTSLVETSLLEILESYIPIDDPSVSTVTPLSEDERSTSTMNLSSKGLIPSTNNVPLNILLKGVPGTGKSYLIDQIITEHLNLGISCNNVVRINVHSASDNTSFMQGVGVSLKEESLTYLEKQGSVLRHLLKAIQSPMQPFVLVLEEIQENSLNELIGDLIYLIEEGKRTDIHKYITDLEGTTSALNTLEILSHKNDLNSIRLPSLVEDTAGLPLVFPKNLYVFCTTNFRDDKKIIEDNLLRRFEVIDLFPKTSEMYTSLFKNESVRNFIDSFNTAVLDILGDTEPHPDRFMIGHSRFMSVNSCIDYMRALKKVVDEFKEIRDIDFSLFSKILNKSKLPIDISILESDVKSDIDLIISTSNSEGNYASLIKKLQGNSGFAFSI